MPSSELRPILLAALLALPSLAAAAPSSLTPVVLTPVRADTSRPLSEMASLALPPPAGFGKIEEVSPSNVDRAPFLAHARAPESAVDRVVQSWLGVAAMPPPLLSVEGTGNVNALLPPDTNGDVGRDHYLQWVNVSLQVFAKDGTVLLGPTPGRTFWYGFGGDCETRNDGDPIVLYDHLADRWLVSQFTLSRHQCVAVSATSDPLGPWHRYDYTPQAGRLPDYPKLGLWENGYGYTARLFGATFQGSFAGTFERARMLVGDPGARLVGFVLSDDQHHALLPADLDGPAPPIGTPQPFVGMVDGAWGFAAPYDHDTLIVWQLAVNWDTPELSTFTESARLDLDAAGYSFDSNLCGYTRSCVPQPGTAVGLDAISDRLMYRPQLRQRAGWRSLVVAHTVDVDGTDHAGLRWYELRDPGTGWTIEQAGTYAPDANHRFMGDVAMDRNGNLMAGFSVSGGTVFPSIRVAGRLASDPPGVLAQGETEMVTGGGSQLHSASRWGDYSSLSVDPVDDCTFWYTQEYLQTTGQAPWRTRIAAIRFPSCTAGPTGTLAGTVIAAATGAPVADARVSAGPGWTMQSGPSGAWSLDVPVASYDVSVRHEHFAPARVDGVDVTTGATTTVDVALDSGLLSVTPSRLDARLGTGDTASLLLTVTNSGTLEAAATVVPLARELDRVPPLSDHPDAETPLQGAAAEAVASWPTDLDSAYGIAADGARHTVWVGTSWGTKAQLREYLADGTPTGRSRLLEEDPFTVAADLCWDPESATIWVLTTGLHRCLREVDPGRGPTGAVLCPAWPSPPSGLAWDPNTGTFLASTPADGSVVRVDRTGAIVGSFSITAAASGLGYNPSTRHLFALQGSDVLILDLNGPTPVLLGSLPLAVADGAGLELGCDGTLWAVDAIDGSVTAEASGETPSCPSLELPWLALVPDDVLVPAATAGGSGSAGIEVQLQADATPSYGTYLAKLTVDHDTPPEVPPIEVSLTRAFADVPNGYWADAHIHALAGLRVTLGCGNGEFCPEEALPREQAAVMIGRMLHGRDFVPPAAVGVFRDVPPSSWAATWIEQVFSDGVTNGCRVDGGDVYFCPLDTVTRDQMAVLICRARGWAPVAPVGLFTDVPTDSWAAGHIERLAAEGVTLGCGGGRYCPGDPVTRAQIAVFLVRAWRIEMVPP